MKLFPAIQTTSTRLLDQCMRVAAIVQPSDLRGSQSDSIHRACLITLHSNFEIFQNGHQAVDFMLDRRIFERWFRITPHDVGLKCFPDKL